MSFPTVGGGVQPGQFQQPFAGSNNFNPLVPGGGVSQQPVSSFPSPPNSAGGSNVPFNNGNNIPFNNGGIPSQQPIPSQPNSGGQFPPGTGAVGDCKIFQDIYNGLNGKNPDIISAFGNCCTLSQFITCSGQNQILRLSLSGLGLNGDFPPAITTLRSLQILDLSFNDIRGPIPSTISDLTQLQWLLLASTGVRDILPFSIGQLPQLRFLTLSRTQVKGGFPPGLNKLTGLAIDGSWMTGPLEIFQSSPSLQYFMANNSGLNCPLPNLPNILFINVGDTNVNGPIPPTLLKARAGNQCGFYNTELVVPQNGIKPPGCENEKFDGSNNVGAPPGAPPRAESMSAGTIIGAIIGALVLMLLSYYLWRWYMNRKAERELEESEAEKPPYGPPDEDQDSDSESGIIKPKKSLSNSPWRLSEPSVRMNPELQYQRYQKDKARQLQYEESFRRSRLPFRPPRLPPLPAHPLHRQPSRFQSNGMRPYQIASGPPRLSGAIEQTPGEDGLRMVPSNDLL